MATNKNPVPNAPPEAIGSAPGGKFIIPGPAGAGTVVVPAVPIPIPRSGGGGRSSSPSPSPTPTPSGPVSSPDPNINTPAPTRAELDAANPKYAVFYPGTHPDSYGRYSPPGYYTSDNKFFPLLSKDQQAPAGYIEATGVSSKGGIGIIVNRKAPRILTAYDLPGARPKPVNQSTPPIQESRINTFGKQFVNTLSDVNYILQGGKYGQEVLSYGRDVFKEFGIVGLDILQSTGRVLYNAPIVYGSAESLRDINIYSTKNKVTNINVSKILGRENADLQDYITAGTSVIIPFGGKFVLAGVTAASLYFAPKAAVNFIEDQSAKNTADLILASAPLIPLGRNIYLRTIAGEAEEEIAFGSLRKSVAEQSRQRGAFFPEVVNEAGESLGVVLGKNKFGEYISIGGAIEKGELVGKATLRELFEESGLTIDDVRNFRSQPTFATAEETQNVFRGEITPETFAKLTPGSDIIKFDIFKPEDFARVTGPSAEAPRFVTYGNQAELLLGGGKKVRITEAGILSQFNDEVIITNQAQAFRTKTLSVTTEKGKINLYLQSRYDIPIEFGEKYFNLNIAKDLYKYSDLLIPGEKLTVSGFAEPSSEILKISKIIGEGEFNKPQLITTGTFKPLVLNEAGDFIVRPELTQRGKAAGVYFQPPISPGGRGFSGLSYPLGGATEYEFSILPRFSPRTVIYSKSVVSKEILNIAKDIYAKNKNDFNVEQMQLILNKEILSRPELFGKVGATIKSVAGIETELVAYGGGFKFTGKQQVVFLEGKPVTFKSARRITNPSELAELRRLSNEYEQATNPVARAIAKRQIQSITGITAEEFSGRNVRYVSLPETVYGAVAKEISSNNISEEAAKIRNEKISFVYEYTNPEEVINNSPEYNQPIKETRTYGRYYKDPIVTQPYFGGGYYEEPPSPGRSPTTGEYTGGPPRTPPIFGLGKGLGAGDIRRTRRRSTTAYSVLLKRRGKFLPIATGLPRNLALLTGERAALRNIARTSKIVESGITDIPDVASADLDQKLFRQYSVRKGRAIYNPNIIIQRQRRSITSPEEKSQLKEARRISRIMKGI